MATLDEILRQAQRRHQSGDLDGALAGYRDILAQAPGHGGALHGCGLVLLARDDGAGARDHLRRAVAAAPERPLYRFNLGLALGRHGERTGAVAAYREAVRLKPDFADAWNNLGLLLDDDPTAAERAFAAAVTADPGHAAARVNLARLQVAGRRRDAAAATLTPLLAAADPPAEAWFLKGTIDEDEQRFDAAIACYERALARDPGFARARNNIGTALLGLGRHGDAQHHFQAMFAARRGPLAAAPGRFDPAAWDAPDTPRLRTCRARLVDAGEQLRHLVAAGLLDATWEAAASRYDAAIATLDATGGDPHGPQVLDGAPARALGRLHEHAVRYADIDLETGPAVGMANDWRAIEDGFLAGPTSITTIDGFLSPDAHAALHRFSLESTIFFGHNPTGYVTSYMADGFACSLLTRIAAELQVLMPRVLGRRQLHNMWIYRHEAEGAGVEAHTDDAAVTFNFWIGPPGANLDPEHGGLVLYQKEQPLDWDWSDINLRKNAPDVRQRIADFLAGAARATVAHRPNRAVLFGSNMFHHSDAFRFRDGFANRRTNVTLLFGERGT